MAVDQHQIERTVMTEYMVMGVNTWPEPDEKDFPIVYVKEGEHFADAILRAQAHYSPEIQIAALFIELGAL